MGTLVIDLNFFFLQWFLFFCTPVVVIDGVAHRVPWGIRAFQVPAGWHQVHISFRYFWTAQCNPAEGHIHVGDLEEKRLRYRPALLTFLKGQLTEVRAALPPRVN